MESFIKKVRWKAFLFKTQCEDNDEITDNFGFKLVKTPPNNDNLNQLESDLCDMVQNIEFKKVKSTFQMQLSDDEENIKEEPEIVNTN